MAEEPSEPGAPARASARLLQLQAAQLQVRREVAAGEPPVTPIAPGCGASARPSRRREEARALLNLQRRVEAARRAADFAPAPQLGPGPTGAGPSLDNRPLLHKVLSATAAGGARELETDWARSEFVSDCLQWHNAYRARHGAPPLALCPQLCAYAQAWANHLAHCNSFYYRAERDVGQNLFCRHTTPGFQTDVTGQEVASYWYSAVRQYNYLKEPDVLHANVNAGHFTQLVWSGTRWLGLGKARSRAGKLLVVAHYRPPGNVSGAFQQNVRPPLPEYEPSTSGESGGSAESSAASRSTADVC